MKGRLLRAIAAGLLLSVVADDASAQGRRAFGLLAIGPAVPLGEFGDAFGTGWDLMAGGGVALQNVPVELRATVNLGSFKASGTALEGTSKPRGLNCDVLYRLGSEAAKVRPYVLGGAGYYSVKYSSGYSVPGEGGGGYSESDNGFSFGAGGGVTAQTGSVAAFAEARYTSISGSGHSHLPLFVGLRFGGR